MVMTWRNSTRLARAQIQRVVKPKIGSSASVTRLKRRRRILTILGQNVLSYFENLLVAGDIHFHREKPFCKGASMMSHLASFVGIFEHPTNLLCEHCFISGRYEEARNTILHHLRDATHITADSGCTRGHRLNDHTPQSFR